MSETAEPPSKHDPSQADPLWACPQCAATLTAADATLRCRTCSRVWDKSPDGYLDMLSAGPYWGEIPHEQAEQLVEMTRSLGPEAAWNALRPGLTDPALPDYALSPRRGAFLPALLPDGRGRALDIGAGYGAVARCLTRYFQHVVALEPVRERVAFLALCGTPGPGRLDAVRGSWWSIPLCVESLDLVTVIGVLEWVGMEPPGHRGAASPRELQREFLSSLRSLLTPGGRVIVGIENRYGLDLWRGAPDHLGHRYTSLVPRWLADRIVRSSRGGFSRLFHGDSFHKTYPEYRVWTYSSRNYQKLFLEAGFSSVEVLPCWGSYVWPELVGGSDDVAQRLEPRVARGRGRLLKRSAWRVAGSLVTRSLAPSFFIVAER